MNWKKFEVVTERIMIACITAIVSLLALGFVLLAVSAAYVWLVKP